MLNKEQILDKLKHLEMPADDYCVMTGAALVLHGVKQETADIDIGCSSKLFEELLRRGFKIDSTKAHTGIIIDGCIEIFENWMPDSKLIIQGIPVAGIQDIRKYKERLGREKDIRDLELIDRFLENNQK